MISGSAQAGLPFQLGASSIDMLRTRGELAGIFALEGSRHPNSGVNEGESRVLSGTWEKMERANGFEPSTCTLARYRSTN